MDVDANLDAGNPAGVGDGQPVGEPAEPQGPQEHAIDPQGLYKIPGQAKAVKWDDYHRNFQSSFTKASQEAARLKAEQAKWAQERQSQQQQLAEYQRRERLAEIQRVQTQKGDAISALRELPYLRGEEAAQLAEGLHAQFGQMQSALGQRDQVIMKLAEVVNQLKGQLGPLMEQHSGAAFENKIGGYLTNLGLSDSTVAKELAKEIYLAYEGEDLDQEFPNIFQNRWNQLEQDFAKRSKAKADAARRNPFVPGRGGAGVPSRPLQARGNETAKEIAERLWPGESSQT
jgi:hypothetical protein